MRRRAQLGRAIALLVVVGGVVQLSACGCDSVSAGAQWDNTAIDEMAQDADVVFIGAPVHENGSALSSRTEYVFEVATVFKGELATEVLVVVEGLAGCGVASLELNREMAIFGSFDGDSVRLASWRTAVAEQDLTDALGALGDGTTPTEQVELARPDGLRIGRLFGSTALLYAGLGLGVLAVFSLVSKWASGSRE